MGIRRKILPRIELGHGGKILFWVAVTAVTAGGLAMVFMVRRNGHGTPITLEGAVISQSSQAEKESPISGAEVTASIGNVSASGKSDSSGFFKLTLQGDRPPGVPIILKFRRVGYQPLEVPVIGGGRPYVARMVSSAPPLTEDSRGPSITVSNISVRYSAKTATAANVGSIAKTFQVTNTGGVPCSGQQPCSPDGKWKAAEGSISLDAGEGNVFRNVRASCIAGPCPFTKITPRKFPRQGRVLKAKALDWSDTATFLVEAEVYHPLQNAEVRKSYPVIFGRVLDFTLPASAEGICIEADLHGDHIIFPSGPNPVLPWADCTVASGQNGDKAYRCSLKNGYRF